MSILLAATLSLSGCAIGRSDTAVADNSAHDTAKSDSEGAASRASQPDDFSWATCAWRMTTGELLSPLAGVGVGAEAAEAGEPEAAMLLPAAMPFVAPFYMLAKSKRICNPNIGYLESFNSPPKDADGISSPPPPCPTCESPCVRHDPNATC